MTEIEFGSRPAANTFRDEHPDALCSQDDRRLKTVTLAPDAPDRVVEEATVQAAATRDDRDGTGQLPLTDGEKDRIDFTETNVPHAKAVKALMRDEGVDDWVAFYDATLTVDEHRDVAERATRDEQGQRMDAETSNDERLAATERALGEECDHARGHCQHGDPEACEFLTESCDFSEEEVDRMLNADPDNAEAATEDGEQITGQPAGALKQAWGGYEGAVATVEESITEYLRPEWQHAQQAARAINAIREQHGQDPLHFERLEELQANMLDLARMMAADCHECHADHSGHEHAVTEGTREDVREFAEEGRGSTPVGSGGDLGDDPTDEVPA